MVHSRGLAVTIFLVVPAITWSFAVTSAVRLRMILVQVSLDPNASDFKEKRRRQLDKYMRCIESIVFRGGKKNCRQKKKWRKDLSTLKKVVMQLIAYWRIAHRLPFRTYTAGGLHKHDKLTDYLEAVKDAAILNIGFFGHYHANEMIGQQFVLLYDKVISLSDFLLKEEGIRCHYATQADISAWFSVTNRRWPAMN